VDWAVMFGGLTGYIAHYLSVHWRDLSAMGITGLIVLSIVTLVFALTSFERVMNSMRAVRKAHPKFGVWKALTHDISHDKAALDKLGDISLYARYQIMNHETYKFHVPGLIAFIPEFISRKKLKKLVRKRAQVPLKKILLIASPITNFMLRESGRKAGYFVAPPYGLYRMRSYLKRKGLADVHVFDPNLYPEDALQRLDQMILLGQYDVVGFSLTHINMQDEMKLIERVKKVSEENDLAVPFLIGGGNEATHNYKKWLEESFLDGVALGYGETVLEGVVKRLPQNPREASKKWLEKIPGFTFRSNKGSLIRNTAKPVSQEMFKKITFDNEPTISIPYQDYWDHNQRIYEPENLSVRGATLKTIRLFTSSHCPNGCGFCSSSNFLNAVTDKRASVLYLSAEDIFNLVLRNVRRHNPEAIFFNDDDFIIDNKEKKTRKRIIDFCEKVKHAKDEGRIPRRLKFYIQTKVKNVTAGVHVPDEELLRIMKEAGFALIALGIETFSEHMLESPAINKKTTKQMSITAVEGVLKSGITPLVNIILLPPDIRKEDFLETADQVIEFARKGVQFSVNPFIEYFPGAPAFKGIEHGRYSYSSRSVTSSRTGAPFKIPVNLRPGDPEMAIVAENLEKERTKVLTELQGESEWHYKYPPQIVNGLISFMAVFRILVAETKNENESRVLERKAQEIKEVIFQLVQMAKPRRGTGVIRTPQEFSHSVERAHALIKSPGMSFIKAADLVNAADELKEVWPNTYNRIINHLSLFLESVIEKETPYEGNEETVVCIAHGLARVDVESTRTEKILALLNFFFRVSTPILNDYYVDEENVVSFVPEGRVVDTPEKIDEEFAGQSVMIFETHHDDALTHLGNLMERRIIPNARKTALVTMLNDPEGVEDEYAVKYAREKGIQVREGTRNRRVKMRIRREEGMALAEVLGIRDNYVSIEGLTYARTRKVDEQGRMLSYQSVFHSPSRRVVRSVRQKIFNEEPDVIIMPLPKGAYHQNHRDIVRILIKTVIDYNRMRRSQSKPPAKIYFYASNIDQDGFTVYSIDPNVINFFPKEGDERKKELFSIYASQLDRYKRYTELLHRLNMDSAGRELARRRHEGREPGKRS
ncbi:MAG: radical SAM protein, partial [Candidatus Omnitrophota bacterium]